MTDNLSTAERGKVLYERFMRSEYHADWENLPAGTQARWQDAASAVMPAPHSETETLVASDPRTLAITAAHQATEAATELLRFAREGRDIHGPFGDVEVIEKLLDAAKMAIECLTEEDDSQRYSAIWADLKHELMGWI
ncbi:Hypothetical protein NGAL_HAMBI1146_59950 [Neorhizobium galegae bv. officinalis]|nr:Hypothetical protein NGAL_HAMBI1146_59950 [Neorhizobium galegae bv. officinalis]